MYFGIKRAVICSILKLQKNVNNIFSPKNYFNWGLFYKCLLSDQLFLNRHQKRTIAFAFDPLSGKNLPKSSHLEGRKQTRLCIFDDNSKIVDLRAKTCKIDPNWNNFLAKKYYNFFVNSELSKWPQFWVQHTDGSHALSFWATTLKFWKSS